MSIDSEWLTLKTHVLSVMEKKVCLSSVSSLYICHTGKVIHWWKKSISLNYMEPQMQHLRQNNRIISKRLCTSTPNMITYNNLTWANYIHDCEMQLTALKTSKWTLGLVILFHVSLPKVYSDLSCFNLQQCLNVSPWSCSLSSTDIK